MQQLVFVGLILYDCHCCNLHTVLEPSIPPQTYSIPSTMIALVDPTDRGRLVSLRHVWLDGLNTCTCTRKHLIKRIGELREVEEGEGEVDEGEGEVEEREEV